MQRKIYVEKITTLLFLDRESAKVPFTEKGQYRRQKLSKEMKSIINASDEFFVNSGGCKKFFPYGWD